MKIVHLEHKHGGRISEINAISHSTYMGAAEWFYVGDIEWKDGGTSVGRPIPPWAICFDHEIQAAHDEYATVSKAMNDHLKKQGKWHDQKFTKGGYSVCWTPKKPSGSTPL